MGDLLRRLRYPGPVVLAIACVVASLWVGPVLTWLLTIAAFALIIEVATAWFESAGGTGGTRHHRQ
jgi:hypothetical protein